MGRSWQHRLLIVPVMIVAIHILYTYHITETIANRTVQPYISNNSHTKIELQKHNWKIIYWQKPRKTGGTSLFQLIYSNGLYEGVSRKRCHWSRRNRAFDTWDVIKKRCRRYRHKIVGVEYQPFFTSSYLKYKHEPLWNDVLLMTMFRDPIDRVFSELVYQGQFSCLGVVDIDTDIENKLIKCLYQHHAKFTSNIYSKIFSGVWPYANPNGELIQHNIDFNANMTVDELQFGLAKLVLHDFNVILILEMWKKTSIQLRCYGMNNISLRHANVGSIKQYKLANFSKLRQHIIELNRYDIRLYEYGKQLALEKTKFCNQYLELNYTSA